MWRNLALQLAMRPKPQSASPSTASSARHPALGADNQHEKIRSRWRLTQLNRKTKPTFVLCPFSRHMFDQEAAPFEYFCRSDIFSVYGGHQLFKVPMQLRLLDQ